MLRSCCEQGEGCGCWPRGGCRTLNVFDWDEQCTKVWVSLFRGIHTQPELRCFFPEGNPCCQQHNQPASWPVCSIQEQPSREQHCDCGHGGQRGCTGGWILVRTLSCPSSRCHQLSEHLPKASADFQKGKHSLFMAPALSILDHSVPQCPQCHAACARLQQVLAGPPLPWQCCQGSHLFLNPDLSCCFISPPPPTPHTSGRARM